MLCGVADVSRREVVLSTAGHPPPLLIAKNGAEYVDVEIGPPVGVRSSGSYRATTVTVPAGATLIAYTDGLVERRGESLDLGLERLRSVAQDSVRNAHETADAIIEALADQDSDDDTAVLVINGPTETFRWCVSLTVWRRPGRYAAHVSVWDWFLHIIR